MFVGLEATQLDKLRAIAKRLYSENRMNGDEMRDLAHAISSVVDQALPMPESGVLVFQPQKCSCGGSIEALTCDNCRNY